MNSTAMAYVPKMTNDFILDWLEKINMHGPFAPIEQLQQSFSAAPGGADRTPEYHYIRGLLRGRSPGYSSPAGGIDEHIQALNIIAESMDLAPATRQFAGGFRDGLLIRSGFFG